MKRITIIFAIFSSLTLLISCTPEDDIPSVNLEKVFTKTPENSIQVDLVYITSGEEKELTTYKLDFEAYLNDLNGYYFHRNKIDLKKGEIRELQSKELYDLRDNRGHEATVLEEETKNDYNPNHITIYVMKRSNIYAKAGVSIKHRALITDEFLHTSTSPHELGHVLGLTHSHEEGNIMNMTYPELRTEFTMDQVQIMTKQISNNFSK